MISKKCKQFSFFVVALTIFFNAFGLYATIATESNPGLLSQNSFVLSKKSNKDQLPVQENEDSNEEDTDSEALDIDADDNLDSDNDLAHFILKSAFFEFSVGINNPSVSRWITRDKGFYHSLPLYIRLHNFRI